jgi:DNA-binding transcriptional LysR family regulator
MKRPVHAPAELSATRLRTFLAVAEEGSYSAAARRLGVTQPTVSFHVRSLEGLFGDGLVEQRGQRTHVTAAGESLARLARRVLRDIEETRDDIASLHAGQAGRVRLGASIAFEQRFFFDVVVRPFVERHPSVELALSFGTTRDVAEALRSRELGAGYVMGIDMPDDVRFTPLHGSSVALFVACDHPLAAVVRPGAEAISAAGLITAPLHSHEWSYYGHMLQGVGLLQYRVAVEVSGIQARMLAAQAGMGVLAVFWPPYAPAPPALPGLQALDTGPQAAPGPVFGLVTRADEPLERPVAAFAGWLEQQVRADG